jgi:RNA polymerase sigma-70 factor (ECF subfamily)
MYLRFAPKVHAMVLRRTGDAYLAEDVAQETLMRAYRFRERIDHSRPIWPWLSKIAMHTCSNMLRGKRTTAEQPAGITMIGRDDYLARLSAEDAYIARSGASFPEVPPRYWRALMLKHVMRLQYDEIGELEGITAVGVDTLLLRSKRALLKALKERNQ